jgi:hypothetical protein
VEHRASFLQQNVAAQLCAKKYRSKSPAGGLPIFLSACTTSKHTRKSPKFRCGVRTATAMGCQINDRSPGLLVARMCCSAYCSSSFVVVVVYVAWQLLVVLPGGKSNGGVIGGGSFLRVSEQKPKTRPRINHSQTTNNKKLKNTTSTRPFFSMLFSSSYRYR